jgi:hypothetical protein
MSGRKSYLAKLMAWNKQTRTENAAGIFAFFDFLTALLPAAVSDRNPAR